MTTTEHQLRVFLESSAARTLARVDPTAFLASLISQPLEGADMWRADATPADITRLAGLPAGQREVALHQGLIAHDTDTAEQIADILLRIGPALAQITSGRKHSEAVAAIEKAMLAASDPLARMASAFIAALQTADMPSWDALRALREHRPAIQASISAGENAVIERSGHLIQHPLGEVSTKTRADAGARISDSPITFIGPIPQHGAPRSAATAPQVAELELGLHKTDNGYVVDARLRRSQDDVEQSGSPQHPAPAALDLAALRAEELNLSAYGQLLTEGLLTDRALRDFVVQALSVTQSAGQPLSLQVRIASSAPELHALRWETLCHPTSGDPLALSQHIWMARTLGSADWAPITRPDQHALRALVIIAAPTNLTDFNLAPIDTVRETELARAAFGSRATVIAGHAASLRRIGPALRTGYDILYLVVHGRMIGAEAHLYLAGDDGRTEVVRAAELITRVHELKHRPRLAALTVCNSAGRGDEHAIAALGPQLVAAGVPAVVAAQGNLSIESAATFNPVLFQNLQQHGQIDQAVAEARASIRDRHDWWAPALLTRLRGRQLWE